MSAARAPLFTPLFFLMWGVSFTAFFSAMLLLPTAPFQIQALGGSTFAAGLFLGFLTYASASSAPLTGALGDRVGKRPVLLFASLAVACISLAYGATSNYPVMLALALVHGIFWSSLLSNAAAYLVDIVPPSRRAEGIGYWGLATVVALATAPPTGFWLYERGWAWVCGLSVVLNLSTAAIAFFLPATTPTTPTPRPAGRSRLVEWRVMIIAVSLMLSTFGYGGVATFSAVYADAIQVEPKSIYLTTLAIIVLFTRPFAGRMADRIGYTPMLLPAFACVAVGLGLLAFAASRSTLIVSALVFGLGFGTAYPVFTAYVVQHVPPARRGAAFGSMITAFDMGIGTGSTTLGWCIQTFGFSTAFGLAAAVSGLAVPYFLFTDWWMYGRRRGEVRPDQVAESALMPR